MHKEIFKLCWHQKSRFATIRVVDFRIDTTIRENPGWQETLVVVWWSFFTPLMCITSNLLMNPVSPSSLVIVTVLDLLQFGGQRLLCVKGLGYNVQCSEVGLWKVIGSREL